MTRGMPINPKPAVGMRTVRDRTFYFCSADCLAKFGADPEGMAYRRRGTELLAPHHRSGRDGAAPPITSCIDGEVCELVDGIARMFRSNDEAADGATHRGAAEGSHLKDSTKKRTPS